MRAEITRTKGEAEARAKFLVDNEEALGVKRRAAVFKTPGALADLEFVKNLNPDVSIRVLHSGEGTLWTDMRGASSRWRGRCRTAPRTRTRRCAARTACFCRCPVNLPQKSSCITLFSSLFLPSGIMHCALSSVLLYQRL